VEDCLKLDTQVTGNDPGDAVQALAPAGKRQIIGRMIHNLWRIYFSRRAFVKAERIMDLLIGAHPESAGNYKRRGFLRMELQQPGAARTDLEEYLRLAPDAPDRDKISKQIQSLQEWLVRMN
jgi:regulator of sirC expression with transglutaminase-like and TPR domain